MPQLAGRTTGTAKIMPKHLIRPLHISILLLLSDIAGLLFFINLAYVLRLGSWHGDQWTIVWPISFTLLSLYVLDVYRTDIQISGIRAPVRAIIAVMLAGLMVATIAYTGGYWGNLFGRGVLPIALFLFAVWCAASRYLAAYWLKQRAEQVRWLVLGAGETASLLWNDFRKSESGGSLVILASDEAEKRDANPDAGPPVAGTLADLDRWDTTGYSGIILTLPPPLPSDLVQKLMRFRFQGISVYDLTDFYEHFWAKVPVMHLRSGWLVFAFGFDLIQNPLGLRLKRILDILFALLLLILLSPVFLLVAALIRLDSPGSSIYRQTRVGEGGKTFTLYKFRSMRQDAEQAGAQWAGANDVRITRLGRFLRVTRLDELPQLINVIRGDMSFIGPRPERPEFTSMLEKQIPYYDSRYLVKPGITGWAQVLYPYGASVDDAREKLQYDLYYIKHYSLLLDIAIFFKTIRVVLLGRGR